MLMLDENVLKLIAAIVPALIAAFVGSWIGAQLAL
jgi:hypothetical protein